MSLNNKPSCARSSCRAGPQGALLTHPVQSPSDIGSNYQQRYSCGKLTQKPKDCHRKLNNTITLAFLTEKQTCLTFRYFFFEPHDATEFSMFNVFYCFTNQKKIKRSDVSHAKHCGCSCLDPIHPISREGCGEGQIKLQLLEGAGRGRSLRNGGGSIKYL